MTERRGDHEREVLEAAEGRLFGALGLEHRSRVLTLDGAPVQRARVLEVGSGPPLLLVHGAGMCAAVWAPLLVHLPHRRSIAVDLPGCGLSDPFDYRAVDLRAHGRTFLTAVIAALDLDAPAVVANSLGATFGLYLATEDPARVSHLALFGATGVALRGARASLPMRLYSRPAVGRLLSALAPPVRPVLARRILTRICGQQAVDNLPDEMFDVLAAATNISEPTTRTLMPELFAGGSPRPGLALSDHELARTTTPTRFVWGSDDRFQAASEAERVAGVMPEATTTVVNGGHHPWWNDPEQAADLLLGHLGAPPDPDPGRGPR